MSIREQTCVNGSSCVRTEAFFDAEVRATYVAVVILLSKMLRLPSVRVSPSPSPSPSPSSSSWPLCGKHPTGAVISVGGGRGGVWVGGWVGGWVGVGVGVWVCGLQYNIHIYTCIYKMPAACHGAAEAAAVLLAAGSGVGGG